MPFISLEDIDFLFEDSSWFAWKSEVDFKEIKVEHDKFIEHERKSIVTTVHED